MNQVLNKTKSKTALFVAHWNFDWWAMYSWKSLLKEKKFILFEKNIEKNYLVDINIIASLEHTSFLIHSCTFFRICFYWQWISQNILYLQLLYLLWTASNVFLICLCLVYMSLFLNGQRINAVFDLILINASSFIRIAFSVII